MSRVEAVKTFRQYDSRWGSKAYPRKPDTVSNAGCGPTACADIIASYSKHKKITPTTTVKYMLKHGYAVAGAGTAWAGIDACLKAYGFTVKRHGTMADFYKEMKKENRRAVFLFRGGTKGGVTWTLGGHFLACSGMKIKNGYHYFYMHDPGGRRHDGWYCYETTMKGLIVELWSCYVKGEATATIKATKKTKKAYTGTFPKLPSRGYFKNGDTGTQVKNLQKFLIWAGYNCGSAGADGIYGKSTVEAVNSFEKKNGLAIDGKFGKACLAKAKATKK